ncbi:MAG: hypothetical protein ABGU93_03060 [Acetobacterium sp.]|uniref:hypothetical protein n=1 Tax=Acetobacterium sp. TaxID=1872094 RepID=UPI003242E07C
MASISAASSAASAGGGGGAIRRPSRGLGAAAGISQLLPYFWAPGIRPSRQ